MSDQLHQVDSMKPATEAEQQQIQDDAEDLHTSLADLAALANY